MNTRRNWPLWVLLAVVVLPVLEIAMLMWIGHVIGLWPTLLLLFGVVVLGSVLLRREGRRSMQALREAMGGQQVIDGVAVAQAPRMPTRELSDSALVGLGALLLLLPGFLSDIIAIICLLPVTRPLPRALFAALIRRQGERLGKPGQPVVGTTSYTATTSKPPTADGPIAPNRILPPS